MGLRPASGGLTGWGGRVDLHVFPPRQRLPRPSLTTLPLPPPLTAEGLLELLGELLDHAVALHVVHVVVQGIAGHLPQGAHVHAAHADGEDLDAGVPRALGHLLHIVLGTPVCDNDGNL